jgi:DNA-binding transcriptional LysR family regulator
VLVEEARQLVEIHDRAVARLESPGLTGAVKVGSNEEVDAARMAVVLGRFKQTHPRARLELIVDNTEHLVERVDAGLIDVAVVQVDDQHLRDDDEVLWRDELRWATSSDVSYAEGVVPLVTFGEHCFYRPLSEPLLEAGGIDYTVAFSVATTSGVRGAIRAGLGVGVLGSRYLDDDLVEWQRGASLDPLPEVYQIARAVPGERREIARVLLEAIVGELAGPAPVAEHELESSGFPS